MKHVCKVHGNYQVILPYFQTKIFHNFQEGRKINDINYLNSYQGSNIYYNDSSFQNSNFEDFRYEQNYETNNYYLYQNNCSEINPLNKIEKNQTYLPISRAKRKNKIINKFLNKKQDDLLNSDNNYNLYNLNNNYFQTKTDCNDYYNIFNNDYNYTFNIENNTYNDYARNLVSLNNSLDKTFRNIDFQNELNQINNKENISNNLPLVEKSHIEIKSKLKKNIKKNPFLQNKSYHLKIYTDCNIIKSNKNKYRFGKISNIKNKIVQSGIITKNCSPKKNNNIIKRAYIVKLKNKKNNKIKLNEEKEKEKEIIEDRKMISKSQDKTKEKKQSLVTNKTVCQNVKNKNSIKNINIFSLDSLKKQELYQIKTLDNIKMKKDLILESDCISKVVGNNNIINNNIKSDSINNVNNRTNSINVNETIEKSFILKKNKSSNISGLSKMAKKECNICHKLIDSHLFLIHFNSHPSKIFDWLYLGTFQNACDLEELKRYNINYILNVAFECKNLNLPSNIYELHLKIKDKSDFDIIEYFEQANEFIEHCRMEGGNILIHCKLGISRSPSFIMAYLIQNNKFSADYAFEFVKEKRKKIKPNEGFLYQLNKYDEIVNNK